MVLAGGLVDEPERRDAPRSKHSEPSKAPIDRPVRSTSDPRRPSTSTVVARLDGLKTRSSSSPSTTWRLDSCAPRRVRLGALLGS